MKSLRFNADAKLRLGHSIRILAPTTMADQLKRYIYHEKVKSNSPRRGISAFSVILTRPYPARTRFRAVCPACAQLATPYVSLSFI